jgi:opacity protein-like surface antigen
MNKKIAAAACGLLMSSGIALAQDDMSFYVGGELGYNKHGYASELKDDLASYWTPTVGTAKTKVPTGGLLLGGKFHENFGAEVGYTFFKKAKVDWTNGFNTDYIKANNMYLDLLGYMPIDTCFDLIGAVGVGRFKLKYNDNNAVGLDSSKAKAGFRLGFGAQYKIDEHFAVRGMVRYQRANITFNTNPIVNNVAQGSRDTKAYKSSTSISLGLTYTI